jgi:GH43 family beta-xylosidase
MFRVRFAVVAVLLAVAPFGEVRAPSQVAAPARGLENPLLPSGADPWVVSRDGYFYFMATTGGDLTIRRTRNMADLRAAEKKVVWRPPAAGPYSHDVWAPELHYLDGKWYIYFAADDGRNETHRIWVLEGCPADPLGCEWSLKGKAADASDKWAIDATVLEDAGARYMLWSGWPGDSDGTQNIYIARLGKPWTIEGRRVMISTPKYGWEKVGDRPRQIPPHVNVNEAPEALIRNGRIFVTYSASGCWTDAYAIGMLTAKQGSDLLNARSWTKSAQPVFASSPEAGVYAPGHNSFFRGADGKDWLLYHANSRPGQGCGNGRAPRAQPFGWKADGTPDFGRPAAAGTVLPRP